MKSAGKKPMKATKAELPSTHKDRGKNRYLLANKEELPQQVQKLLQESGKHEQGKLINKLVVKDADGRWAFKLDDSYVQERMRALIARCSRCQHVVVFAATAM